MRPVVWTEPAQADVIRIRRHIARFRPRAAQRMTDDLYAAAEALGEYPERGKPARRGRRELLVIRPYRIVYRVADEAVFVLRVRHTARRDGVAEEGPDLFTLFEESEGDLAAAATRRSRSLGGRRSSRRAITAGSGQASPPSPSGCSSVRTSRESSIAVDVSRTAR